MSLFKRRVTAKMNSSKALCLMGFGVTATVDQVSISPMFCAKRLHAQIQKGQQDSQITSVFCALGISVKQKLLIKHW
jgi:hypothetical protein